MLFASAIMKLLTLYDTPIEPGAEVYSIATAEDQARLVYDAFLSMVGFSPSKRIRDAAKIRTKRCLFPSEKYRDSIVRPLGSESKNKDGLNPRHRRRAAHLAGLLPLALGEDDDWRDATLWPKANPIMPKRLIQFFDGSERFSQNSSDQSTACWRTWSLIVLSLTILVLRSSSHFICSRLIVSRLRA